MNRYAGDYVADMHTHTIASGHAYNTILEMAESASKAGIKMLGITEHSMTMPGTCSELYFRNLHTVKREAFGVELHLGVELNIINYKGEVDMSEELLKKMDVVIASIHNTIGYNAGNVDENTSAIVGAMNNPYVNIIGHPDDGNLPMNYEIIVKEAKKTGKLIEINNNSLTPGGFRRNPEENDRRILELCKELNVPVIIGSDAHTVEKVGNNSFALALMEEVNFPEELIMNFHIEELKKHINN